MIRKTTQATKGNSCNISCPHCGKNNHYVTHGHIVELGKIINFTRTYIHCSQIIYFKAQYEIVVTAYGTDPLAFLNKQTPQNNEEDG